MLSMNKHTSLPNSNINAYEKIVQYIDIKTRRKKEETGRLIGHKKKKS